jgi:hypothetical protein
VRITGWPNAVDSGPAESGAVDLSVADPGSIDFGSVDSVLKGEFSRVAELLAKRINAAK